MTNNDLIHYVRYRSSGQYFHYDRIEFNGDASVILVSILENKKDSVRTHFTLEQQKYDVEIITYRRDSPAHTLFLMRNANSIHSPSEGVAYHPV